MKTTALILFFAFVTFGLFSDDMAKDVKYSRGKIFLPNNDTLDVYIKVESLYNMQSGIQYVDSTGNEYSLIPSKAKGFCLLYKNDTMYFESRKDLKMVLFSSRKSKSSFIHRISNGNLPLYSFVEKKLVRDGIDQVLADFPRYMVLLDQEWFSITVKYFVSDLKRLFSNLKGEYNAEQMKALMNEIEDGKYKFEDTPLIIERSNKIPAAHN